MTTATNRLTAFQVIAVDDGQTDLIWIDANDVNGFHQCGDHEFTFVSMRDGRELNVRHYASDFKKKYDEALGEDSDLATLRQQNAELLAACKFAESELQFCLPVPPHAHLPYRNAVLRLRAVIAKRDG